MQHGAMQCGTMQHDIVQAWYCGTDVKHCTSQHGAMQRGTMQHGAVQHGTMQHDVSVYCATCCAAWANLELLQFFPLPLPEMAASINPYGDDHDGEL